MIPATSVEVGEWYIMYRLMGMYGNDKLRDGMPKELRARVQGKTCFNFRKHDEKLFKELV